MTHAIILYGSRARGDHSPSSDTDILGVVNSSKILKPYDRDGLSFHLYPEKWLIDECRRGSLFMLHITTEARTIHDPQQCLKQLKRAYRYKANYHHEKNLSISIMLNIINDTESVFSGKKRKIYFWALRTLLIAISAEIRVPTFSARSLQALSQICELQDHIDRRFTATHGECISFASKIIGSEFVKKSLTEYLKDRQENERLFESVGYIKSSLSAYNLTHDTSMTPSVTKLSH